MSDLLFWLMAHLGRRGTAILLTVLIFLAFVAFLLFIVWFAVKFPGVAIGAIVVLGLASTLGQFILTVIEAIEEHLPERKSKDEFSD